MNNNTNIVPLSETLSDKETFIEVYKYTLYKGKSSLITTFLMGFAAGCFVGIAYIGSIYITRGWPVTWPIGLKSLVFGVTFTLAITMIIFMGGSYLHLIVWCS